MISTGSLQTACPCAPPPPTSSIVNLSLHKTSQGSRNLANPSFSSYNSNSLTAGASRKLREKPTHNLSAEGQCAMKLTATTIHALSLPSGTIDKVFFDDDLAGFGLRMRAS